MFSEKSILWWALLICHPLLSSERAKMWARVQPSHTPASSCLVTVTTVSEQSESWEFAPEKGMNAPPPDVKCCRYLHRLLNYFEHDPCWGSPVLFFLGLTSPLVGLLQPDSLCSWLILQVYREPKEGKHSYLGCFLQTARQALQFPGQQALVRVSAGGLCSEAVARMVPVWSPDDPSVGSFPSTKNHQLHHTLEERSSALSWS